MAARKGRARARSSVLVPVLLVSAIVLAASASQLLGAITGERPTRIRQEQRDELEKEEAVRKQVESIIERTCEAVGEQGEQCDFEAVRENAISQLGQAAEELYAEQEVEDDESEESGRQLVCFDANGEVTNDRTLCAESQSEFFGLLDEEASEEEYDEESFDEDAFGYDQSSFQRPSDDFMNSYMDQYRTPSHPAMGGQPFHGSPMEGGDFMTEIKRMMAMAEKMMPKLDGVMAIFEKAGIKVPEVSRRAAKQAQAAFAKLREPCEKGDLEACMELGNTMSSIEPNMRPPMEQAVFDAIKSGDLSPERAMTFGPEVEAYMSEGMEDTMGPPHRDMGGPMGYPSGAPYGRQGGYGQPSGGYDYRMQGGYGMPPQGYPQGGGYNNMPQDYGYPQGGYGMPQGGYGNEGYGEWPQQY